MIIRHGFYPFLFMRGLFFWGLIILGLIVLGIIVWTIVRRGRHNGTAFVPAMNTNQEDTALTILRERFARGEISKAEYDEMHQALVSS
ncbi:MAG: SHOCT domain-containing protein [Anaerolineae bacterium]|jgi:uncharacterized membrane protein